MHGILLLAIFFINGGNKFIENVIKENSSSFPLYNFFESRKGILGWIILLSENFESGLIPHGWKVIDGNGDDYKWRCGTTSDLGPYVPPNYGTKYAYYSDDDAGSGVINYNEEFITPKIGIPLNITNLIFKYSYGFAVYQAGEKYRIHLRKKINGLWTEWIAVKVYTASSAGIDSIDLTNYLPCDSMQFRFFYSDSTAPSHWGFACACDNVILRGFAPYYHDVGVTGIISPRQEIVVGVPIPVLIKYTNFGDSLETFYGIVRIFNPSNTLIFSKDTNLSINGGEHLEANFGEFVPSEFGLHFIYSKIFLQDQYPGNDSFGYHFETKELIGWIPYSEPPLYFHRYAHATVYDSDNDKIYMTGGTQDGTGGGGYLYAHYRYDPETDLWSINLPSLPMAKGWIGGVYSNGKIFVPGGYTNSSGNTNFFHIYNTIYNSWAISGPPLREPKHAYAISVWNGNVYVIGGIDSQLHGTKTVFRYNIENNIWTYATSLPRPFDMGGCAYLNDTIYLVGGFDRSVNEAWTHILRGIINHDNPDSIIWEWIAPLPYPNMNNAACALPGKIYMIGGFINATTPTGRVWEFDINTGTWTELPEYPVPITRNNFAVARPQRGNAGPRIYVVAGDAFGNWFKPNNYYFYLEKGVSVYEKPKIKNHFSINLNSNIIRSHFSILLNFQKSLDIEILLYNLTGQRIKQIYKGKKEKGFYKLNVNVKDLQSGNYFIIVKTPIESSSFRFTKIE